MIPCPVLPDKRRLAGDLARRLARRIYRRTSAVMRTSTQG